MLYYISITNYNIIIKLNLLRIRIHKVLSYKIYINTRPPKSRRLNINLSKINLILMFFIYNNYIHLKLQKKFIFGWKFIKNVL